MINALLVRWAGGWHEVVADDSVAAHGRHEALLGLGAVSSEAEVDRLATDELIHFQEGKTAIAADMAPTGFDDVPYVDFAIGDTISVPALGGGVSSERLVSLTVAEDENGVLTYAPELKDVVLTAAERYEQALKKMADGTIGGQSAVATPVGQPTTRPSPVRPVTTVQLPSTGGGLPPYSEIHGIATMASGDRLTPPLAVDDWYQSPSLDGIVSAFDEEGGTTLLVKAVCALMITMEVEFSLNSNGTGSGDTGKVLAGFQIDPTGGVIGNNYGGTETWGEHLDGTWRRAAFEASATTPVGITCVRTIRFVNANSSDHVAHIKPDIYQSLGYSKDFAWKLTVHRLEDPTFHSFRGD